MGVIGIGRITDAGYFRALGGNNQKQRKPCNSRGLKRGGGGCNHTIQLIHSLVYPHGFEQTLFFLFIHMAIMVFFRTI